MEQHQPPSPQQAIPPFVRVNSNSTDSREIDIQGAVQPAAEASAPGGVQIETTPVYSSAALELEAFMREELEIILSEPGNENDAAFTEVNVNGDYRLLLRNGEPQKVRRYHVAVLAQAKQSRVRQRKIVQGDGSMGFIEENVLSLSYPFTVLADSRKGSQWLRELIKVPV
jgi:hypothetical protein